MGEYLGLPKPLRTENDHTERHPRLESLGYFLGGVAMTGATGALTAELASESVQGNTMALVGSVLATAASALATAIAASHLFKPRR